MEIEEYKVKEENGYNENKDIVIKKIDGIKLNDFRGIKNETIELGDFITVLAGKNGTMKSTILGLLAHPFSSPNNAKDVLGNPLKTNLSDVFRLSPVKDNKKYSYNMYLTDVNDKKIKEIVRVWYYEKDNRFRIFVGEKNIKGVGNFWLNTCYINLKRLFPMVDTKAKVKDDILFSNDDAEFIFKQYQSIFQRTTFQNSEVVSQNKIKDTLGPNDTYYDFNSISSGEDNLGNIIIKLLAFKNNQLDNEGLNGILCIDELEASMHPVAQEKLFNSLYTFAKKYKIQIVFTTHSLYLIQYIINMQYQGKPGIVLNILSTQYVAEGKFRVVHNPNYKTAYKELTFRDKDSLSLYKPNIIVEDKVAGEFFKKIIKEKRILDNINLITDLSSDNKGNSYTYLKTLIKNGTALLEDSIIIFDADVDLNDLKSNVVPFFKFPDLKDFAIERRIIKWIYDLEAEHPFFKEINKEKAIFISSFSDSRIDFLNDEEKVENNEINIFKKWSEQDKRLFFRCMTLYVRYEEKTFEKFREDIINSINAKRRDKSLRDL